MSEAKRPSSEDERKDASEKGEPRRRGRTPTKNKSDVGKALRSVYDTTLNEDVPDDFLDLLGKLD